MDFLVIVKIKNIFINVRNVFFSVGRVFILRIIVVGRGCGGDINVNGLSLVLGVNSLVWEEYGFFWSIVLVSNVRNLIFSDLCFV